MALRVVRPRCPHTEDKARNIERRDPCGHAAEWLLRQQCKRYKKTLSFCTKEGVTRYLPFDKEGKILDVMLSKCKNLLDLDEFRRRFTNAKI